MRTEAYVILQAVGKVWNGFKGDGRNPNWGKFYVDKESATEALRQLLMQIKREQGIGWRTPDNLNPETGLDFAIQRIILEVPDELFEKRGWKLP